MLHCPQNEGERLVIMAVGSSKGSRQGDKSHLRREWQLSALLVADGPSLQKGCSQGRSAPACPRTPSCESFPGTRIQIALLCSSPKPRLSHPHLRRGTGVGNASIPSSLSGSPGCSQCLLLPARRLCPASLHKLSLSVGSICIIPPLLC